MKRLSSAIVAAAILIACNNEKKTDESKAADQKEAAAGISYPYTPAYSADFSMGDANHSKMVLDLYKMWENGKIDDMKPLLADSIFIDGPDGFKFSNTLDSCISLMKQIRATYKSIKPVFDTWMPIHHNESKEDYVLVWNRDYSTTTDGKQDSIRIHAYFQIKNNKVRGWSEFQQKLAPPSAQK